MQLLELQPGTKATIMKIDGGRSLLTAWHPWDSRLVQNCMSSDEQRMDLC